MRNHWAILGAGSIGCLWAAKLCQAGISPTLILRPERYQQLTNNVVQLAIQDTNNYNADYAVNTTTAEAINQPVDILIVCTKAQHAHSAVQSIKHRLHTDTIILLLQNGMGSQQAITSSLPHHSIWAGSVTDGAYLISSFVVCHAGKGSTLTGKLSGPALTTEKYFIDVLNQLQLDIQITPDIKQKLWNKLAINCCINGLTALYNCKNGELLDSDHKQQHLSRLITETETVFQALDKPPQGDLKSTVEEVCQKTASNISSTCNDVRMERVTELNYINGYLMRAASVGSITIKEYERLLSALKKQGVKI